MSNYNHTMKSEIIVIGDELLIGQVLDTNSKWMATELNKQGWEVSRITTISDGADDIKEAITSAFSRVDVVLMTGGLGPTSDDVTKRVLCAWPGQTPCTHVLFDPLDDSYPHLPEEDTEAQLLERRPALVSLSPKLTLLTVVHFSGAKGETV